MLTATDSRRISTNAFIVQCLIPRSSEPDRRHCRRRLLKYRDRTLTTCSRSSSRPCCSRVNSVFLYGEFLTSLSRRHLVSSHFFLLFHSFFFSLLFLCFHVFYLKYSRFLCLCFFFYCNLSLFELFLFLFH